MAQTDDKDDKLDEHSERLRAARARAWDEATDPDELLGMLGRVCVDTASELCRPVGGRVAHLIRPEDVPAEGTLIVDFFRWARAVEMENAKDWVAAKVVGAQDGARYFVMHYADHASRAHQCAVIRQAVANPWRSDDGM